MSAAPLAAIARLIGDEAARTLCERLGGTLVYIPVCPGAASPLVLAIGHTAAARLADALGGTALRVPSRLSIERQRRRAAILYDLRRGLPPGEVATRHGVTDSHVRAIRGAQEH